MSGFARFIMRDNGLAVHIASNQVTQVRETVEGDPAIYLVGKDTPLMVEGDVLSALRKLHAAATGIVLVEPEFEPEPEPVAVSTAKPAKTRKPKAPKAKAAVVTHARISEQDDAGDSGWFMGAR